MCSAIFTVPVVDVRNPKIEMALKVFRKLKIALRYTKMRSRYKISQRKRFKQLSLIKYLAEIDYAKKHAYLMEKGNHPLRRYMFMLNREANCWL